MSYSEQTTQHQTRVSLRPTQQETIAQILPSSSLLPVKLATRKQQTFAQLAITSVAAYGSQCILHACRPNVDTIRQLHFDAFLEVAFILPPFSCTKTITTQSLYVVSLVWHKPQLFQRACLCSSISRLPLFCDCYAQHHQVPLGACHLRRYPCFNVTSRHLATVVQHCQLLQIT